MLNHHGFLKVNQSQIQNPAGDVVSLHGVGLGGWMNMENFITGFPANENAFRQIVTRALGKEKSAYFFERYLEYFFTDEDAGFIRSLGLNLLRLPFNYRHFEDDLNPTVIRAAGLKHLDRVIKICADHEIYTILDLHAAAGYQNQDWHSDNPSQQAFFWQHKHFQDRAVWLWEKIAEHYKGNPWVAGYNPLNEPADPTGEMLDSFYQRVVAAIRKIDPDHIIFLDGDRYSQDFSVLGPPLPNVVYTLHNYAVPGFIDGGDYPGISRGEYFDKMVLRERLLETCEYMLENQTPIWVGEFGPVYTGDPQKDAMRYKLLEDQLSFYKELGASWCLWTYKDLGLQGLVGLRPDSKWIQKIRPILEKKAILGVDSWGGLDKNVRHIMEPIEQAFAEFFPNYKPFPFDAQWQINRTVRHILLAEPLMEDFYPLLQGLDLAEIDELMGSFRFECCSPRHELVEIIKKEQQVPQILNLLFRPKPREAHMPGINPNRRQELERDFHKVLDVLAECRGIEKNLVVPRNEFARRQSATWQALEQAGLEAGFVFSDEHYDGDVPYLGGNTNITIEQVAGAIGRSGFHVIAGLEGGYVSEQLATRAGAKVHKVELLQLADEKYPIRAERLEDVLDETAGRKIRRLGLLTPRQVIPSGVVAALEKIVGPENLVDAQELYQRIRYEKSDIEMALIRDAAIVGDAMMRCMLAVLRPGLLETQVAGWAYWAAKELGSEENGWDVMVTSGEANRTLIGKALNRPIHTGEYVHLGVAPKRDGLNACVRRSVIAVDDYFRVTPSQQYWFGFLEQAYRVGEEAYRRVAKERLPARLQEQALVDFFAAHSAEVSKRYGKTIQLETLKPYTGTHNAGYTECQEFFGAITLDSVEPLGNQIVTMLDVAIRGIGDHWEDVILPDLDYLVIENTLGKFGEQVENFSSLPLNIQSLVGKGFS